MNKHIIQATFACGIALFSSVDVHAETIRHYRAGDVPDPRVVARILGAKPGTFIHLPKRRGLIDSLDQSAAMEPEIRDGGHTVTEDDIATNASEAVSAWSAKLASTSQGGGAGMGKAAETAPTAPAGGRGERVTSAAQTQKAALKSQSLKPAAAGKADSLALSITFANNSWRLSGSSKRAIDAVAEGIKLAGFERKVLVEGHTNAVGSSVRNLQLARLRAEAVKRYLSENHGIPKSALVAKGLGSAKPLPGLHPNSPHNRRVQFRALG